MNDRRTIYIQAALAAGLVVAPVAWAQKPPAPTPTPPPTAPPTRPGGTTPTGSQPTQPGQPGLDVVLFLTGRVSSNDSTQLPNDTMVERICNGKVRQQVYAAPRGDFSMQMGSMTQTFLDSSADPSSQFPGTRRDPNSGIPRRELEGCELRASAPGFRSNSISLMEVDTFGENVDVGAIVLKRLGKVKGLTVSAAEYKAPTDARKAYEKGMEAEGNGKLSDARRYFEKAVEIYPVYAIAWSQLGAVLQKLEEKSAAREAYTKATTTDAKLLQPYLGLASMAFEVENWTEVLSFTRPILEVDPLKDVAGYFVDLDPLNYSEAYFYNAVANFKLNKLDEAKRSALKAEQRLTHFPQLNFLVAQIYIRRNDYPAAIVELQRYLDLAPHAPQADQAREQLAKLQKLNDSTPTTEKPDQQ
jgi:hypothetical protein